MGRAPNPGAPQRVSAHVVPKAPSFAAYDEDEKTTIESGGWEEEASTTVEQGEVAEKVRALGLGVEQAARPNTGITSTNGRSMSDEPTVDEQRANVAITLLPPPNLGRLLITHGNDSGQVIEVRPGKTYTIGRALDNDLVLTDMTVSRKHFDLRNENGSWVLADRGSGNGTLVNDRLEDAPFALANGDVIEIGNTTFRFELPNSVPRPPPTFDSSGDDDAELSTMSGTPLQDPEPATPQHLVAPVSRPKTLPPPAPLQRPRAPTRPPAYALDRPSPHSQGHPPLPSGVIAAASAPTLPPLPGVLAFHPQPPPATTLPLPQMANRPPLPPSALLEAPHGAPQTTLPGQGPPMHPAHPARLPFSYPSASEIPQLQPRGSSRAMAIVSAHPSRDAPSTVQVSPMSYSSGAAAMVPQHPYRSPPPLSRSAKLALATAGLALFTAIATIAIVKGTSSDGARALPTQGHGATMPAPIVESIPDPKAGKVVEPAPTRTITPIDPPGTTEPSSSAARPSPAATEPPAATRTEKLAAASPASAAAVPTSPSSTAPVPPSPSSTAPVPPSPSSAHPGAPSPPTTAAPAIASRPQPNAATAPTTPNAAASSAIKPSPATPSNTSSATTSSSATPPPATPSATTPPPATPSATPPPATPPATAVARTEPTASTARTTKGPASVAAPRTERIEVPAPTRTTKPARRPEKRPERKPAPAKAEPRIEVDRTAKTEAPPRSDKKQGRTTHDVKNDASALYRARNFNGAAALVTQSLSSFSGSDVQELKSIAAIYSQLGKAYSVGMAPGTKSTDAYVALRRALNYDRDIGSVYVPEIQEKLVVIAVRAAMQFMAAHEYEAAFQAVRVSESLGSQSPSNKSVRDKLEALADDLLRAAASEIASNPEEARRKARQVQGMVDPRSRRHERATKLLSGS